jgi:hypothetical protein
VSEATRSPSPREAVPARKRTARRRRPGYATINREAFFLIVRALSPGAQLLLVKLLLVADDRTGAVEESLRWLAIELGYKRRATMLDHLRELEEGLIVQTSPAANQHEATVIRILGYDRLASLAGGPETGPAAGVGGPVAGSVGGPVGGPDTGPANLASPARSRPKNYENNENGGGDVVGGPGTAPPTGLDDHHAEDDNLDPFAAWIPSSWSEDWHRNLRTWVRDAGASIEEADAVVVALRKGFDEGRLRPNATLIREELARIRAERAADVARAEVVERRAAASVTYYRGLETMTRDHLIDVGAADSEAREIAHAVISRERDNADGGLPAGDPEELRREALEAADLILESRRSNALRDSGLAAAEGGWNS